jgi:hypothetical protein
VPAQALGAERHARVPNHPHLLGNEADIGDLKQLAAWRGE